MKLAVIGINHKTAPVELREQLSFGADLGEGIKQLSTLTDGCTIVSTCNRSELYVGIDDVLSDEVLGDGVQSEQAAKSTTLSDPILAVCQWLADFKGVNLDNILPYLYTYEGTEALNHWLRVAAGLDSMILGEPQILGQIRQAVGVAREHGGISSDFGWITQQVFAGARTVRRDTKVGAQAVTMGFATAKLATQIFNDPSKLTFLVVAAGEMNRLVAHNVAALGVKKIIIANRSAERAQLLANELSEMADAANRAVEIQLAGLDELDDVLAQADIVSSCSGSMQALISTDMVHRALKARRHQPMLLVDLAVPRDIEPTAGQLDDVYLYSVDDLQHVIAGNIAERKQAAVEAEVLVGQLVSDIEEQMQVQTARGYIRDYRQMADGHTERLLARALMRLDHGDDAKAVVELLAHELSQTLMHSPSRMIRTLASHGDAALLDVVAETLTHSYRDKQV